MRYFTRYRCRDQFYRLQIDYAFNFRRIDTGWLGLTEAQPDPGPEFGRQEGSPEHPEPGEPGRGERGLSATNDRPIEYSAVKPDAAGAWYPPVNFLSLVCANPFK